MAVGDRIRYFRTKRGMTQKYLGQVIGFPERSADVRLAQYESGSRTPRADLIATLAHYLEISPDALNVPGIDTDIGLMHTLFALEDQFGLKVSKVEGEICLKVDMHHSRSAVTLHSMLCAWQEQAEKLKTEEITDEDYDRWRYYYPRFETTNQYGKISSLETSKLLMNALKKQTK